MHGIPVNIVVNRHRSRVIRLLANGKAAPREKWYLHLSFKKENIAELRNQFGLTEFEDVRVLGNYNEERVLEIKIAPLELKFEEGECTYTRIGYKLTNSGAIQFPTLFNIGMQEPLDTFEPFRFKSMIWFKDGIGKLTVSPLIYYVGNSTGIPLNDYSTTNRKPSTTSTFKRGKEVLNLPPVHRDERAADYYIKGKIVNVSGYHFGDFEILSVILPRGKGVNGGESNKDCRWKARCMTCGHIKYIRGKQYNNPKEIICKKCNK